MKISKKGLEIIKDHEGFSFVPYLDSAGLRTIGFGHLAEKGRHNGNIKRVLHIEDHVLEYINEDNAEEVLELDVQLITNRLERLLKGIKLNQNQLDAIISFVYNIGIGAFSRSTLLKKLKVNDYEGAAKEFLRWNKATVNGRKVEIRGLTIRREEEKLLFEEINE